MEDQDIKSLEERLGNIEGIMGSLRSYTNEIQRGVDNIPKGTSLPHMGVKAIKYLTIWGTLIGTILVGNKVDDIIDNYQKFAEVQTKNVIGQKAPEKFYEVNGQRTYLEIDGKPVAQYVKELNAQGGQK